METDEQGMTAFDHVRWQAMNEVSLLEDEINAKQVEINELKEQQRKWNKVIKAASDEPSNGSRKVTTKPSGIREATRQRITDAIQQISVDTDGSFTVEDVRLESNLAESTVARGLNVLRDEGFIRQTGVVGRAPVYKWVSE